MKEPSRYKWDILQNITSSRGTSKRSMYIYVFNSALARVMGNDNGLN